MSYTGDYCLKPGLNRSSSKKVIHELRTSKPAFSPLLRIDWMVKGKFKALEYYPFMLTKSLIKCLSLLLK